MDEIAIAVRRYFRRHSCKHIRKCQVYKELKIPPHTLSAIIDTWSLEGSDRQNLYEENDGTLVYDPTLSL